MTIALDLEEAIRIGREAIDATPSDHPEPAMFLNNVGNRLGDRYARTGAMADLEGAIRVTREAIDATPLHHPDRATLLNNLGIRLGDRYSWTGAMADLEEAIRLTREAIEATPLDHPDRAGWLSNLGNHLGDRYSRTAEMADLEEAIHMIRAAIDATPLYHPNRAGFLINLGNHLGRRYSRTTEMADLEEAIRVGREAIDATPVDHPNRATFLNNLGNRLGDRYSRNGAMADLEEAIRVGREAIDATPVDHPNRATFLNNLGNRLGRRYSRNGAMADLEEAIRLTREAIEATPLHHPDRATLLNNLGIRLGDRYLRIGAMADLEDAIRLTREAIEATPLHHPDRATLLNHLGIRLGDRYLRIGAMADLEEAIRLTREAIDATPLYHPNRAGFLINLGNHLGRRYSRTTEMADLEEAIRVGREAIDATPVDHPNRATFLNNLGNRLGRRYSRNGAMADLEEAIRLTREAIEATPLHHPDRATLLNNLGVRLGDRYSRNGAMADLEEAIRVGREAIDAAPLDHPDRAMFLINLGVRLGDRHSRTSAMADLEEGKERFVAALRQSASAVSMRVAAGRHLLTSPAILQDRQAYAIAKTTIDLIPLLTPRSLQNSDKRHLLSAAVGLSSDATAIALHANRGPAAAIELLETGRGVIAGALFEQSDLAALEREHPDLVRSFIDLRDQLDAPASARSLAAERPTLAAETEGDRRRDAGPQLAALLETIRSKSGFERFLLSASEADMLEAARHGPIVVLNVSSYRCDALVIEQSGIRLLELPHLSREALNDHVRELRTLDTLGWLWDAIVCPILNALGFTGPPSDSQWPQVWWVPTGPLTRFPLHAAGHHLRRTGETAVDRVVSSYASSVKAIIQSRRRPQHAPEAGESRNAVVVAMQNTPKQEPLKHASDEVDAVVAVCESVGLPHTRPRPCKADVSSALEACKMFHFAGHGSTHPTEPLESQLLLDDWDRKPFTVASLLETNLTSKPPFLAYLSACGTGQILDEGSVDESIHLANACQLAGFRHVVGTLWSVNDGLCVDMARMTYEFLRDEGIRDETVSRGLHRAMRTLRDQWVEFEDAGRGKSWSSGADRDAELRQGSEPRRPLWVPYVHFGV
ncbi:CHAT domain-containing protein [Microdochium trichocladiopsis]|uniref:CHAT domain-containing protein n=1 Tax=Microdochium trichocladiopsis TaxID=1682393 RepID=A0A9P8XPS6_9PEZI|nr:CHAT domain-containing protein [Microdochium trichocladiopsis]KAH7009354.1 CHAT domain-containing protein [Microdochium trichocladiopsis]